MLAELKKTIDIVKGIKTEGSPPGGQKLTRVRNVLENFLGGGTGMIEFRERGIEVELVGEKYFLEVSSKLHRYDYEAIYITLYTDNHGYSASVRIPEIEKYYKLSGKSLAEVDLTVNLLLEDVIPLVNNEMRKDERKKIVSLIPQDF